jgi:hypothetical protein
MEKLKETINLRYFLKKKMINFYNLELQEKAPFFSRISRIITKKETINATTSLLNTINSLCLGNKLSRSKDKRFFLTQKHARIFLSSYVGIYHQHVLTSEDDISDDKNAYEFQQKSKKIINTLTRIYNSCVINYNEFMLKLYIEKFIRLFSEYEMAFTLWKEIDEKKILDELMIVYIELLEYKEGNAEGETQHISNELNSVKEKILKLNGNDGIKLLEHNIDLYYKYKDNMKNLYKNIYDSIHRAFWDDLKAKIYNIPPDYSVIIPLLTDIKTLLIQCVPSRIDLKSEIDEIIDIEYIENMIKDNAIEDQYVENLAGFILTQVKTFQARSEDEDTEEIQNYTNGIFRRLKLVELMEERVDIYADFFPYFFKKIFKKLEDIISASSTIRNVVQNY